VEITGRGGGSWTRSGSGSEVPVALLVPEGDPVGGADEVPESEAEAEADPPVPVAVPVADRLAVGLADADGDTLALAVWLAVGDALEEDDPEAAADCRAQSWTATAQRCARRTGTQWPTPTRSASPRG
jgi:hypothetical protein